jgi:hypothetical protein
MRKAIKHEFIQRSSIKEKKRSAYKFLFSVLEKRRIAIIRLIRLVSEGITYFLSYKESLIVERKGVCICS